MTHDGRDRRVTLALVHGGAHGAWCWDRLVPLLEARGYRCVTMDLPCGDESAGADRYAELVLSSLEGVTGEVVLVGHSLGGLTIPVVASRREVSMMIFVAALLPEPGISFRDQQEQETDHIMFPYSGGSEGLRARFYNRCDPADAEWAMSRLRPQSVRPFEEITPLRGWPDTPRHSIVCRMDRACNPIWARRAAVDRLGVEPVELGDADHSPFLSCTSDLADLLVGMVENHAR